MLPFARYKNSIHLSDSFIQSASQMRNNSYFNCFPANKKKCSPVFRLENYKQASWVKNITLGKLSLISVLTSTFCLRCTENQKKKKNISALEDKGMLRPYICEFWNKALFVSFSHLCSWKQTLTWKTFLFFQGNTLNQHPGINLQNAIQAGLCAGRTRGAYKWPPV